MAFALVGVAGAVSTGAVNTAVTPAYGQTPTAGNLLLLFVTGFGTATAPAQPSGWSSLSSSAVVNGPSVRIFYLVAAGGDAAPTIAAAATTYYVTHLEEWSGGSLGSHDRPGSASGTTSPLTATTSGADLTSGELFVMAGGDRRTAARASNDTWTSNNGTPTLRASNNGATSTDHYSHATMVTTSNAAADTAVMTLSLTTSIGGLVIAAGSFKLASGPAPVTGTGAGAGTAATASGSGTSLQTAVDMPYIQPYVQVLPQ